MLLWSLVALLSARTLAKTECRVKAENHAHVFDLSKVVSRDGYLTTETIQVPDTLGHTLRWALTPCMKDDAVDELVKKECGDTADEFSDVPILQIGGAGTPRVETCEASLGHRSKAQTFWNTDPNGGLVFLFQEMGSPDFTGCIQPRDAQTQLEFKCGDEPKDRQVTVIDYPRSELDPCYWQFEYQTPYACFDAPNDGMSGGSVFLIVLLCCLLAYLLGGVLLMHRRGNTGKDLIPNREFWSDLPSLVKDGCKFTFATVTGKKSSGGSYQEF